LKNKKYQIVATVPNTNKKKIIERDKMDTPNTHIHDQAFSWLGTGTSIKSGGFKLILWDQTLIV
jgi:hypothetical protein